MQVKKILLKYQKPQYANTPESVWVDLDSSSGGYPYATNIMRAHDFKTVEEARRYRGHLDEFDIVEVTFTMSENVVEKWADKKRFQVKQVGDEYRVNDTKLMMNIASFFDKKRADAYAKQLNNENL